MEAIHHNSEQIRSEDFKKQSQELAKISLAESRTQPDFITSRLLLFANKETWIPSAG